MQSKTTFVPTLILVGALFLTGCGSSSNQTSQEPVPTPSNGSPTASEAKSYAMADVETHNKESDCWLVIRDGVYDVTSYLSRHPGGADAILRNCGKDASTGFETRPNGPGTPHPAQAMSMLETLKIGDLKK